LSDGQALVLHTDDGAKDAAGSDDLVALLDRLAHIVLLARLLLLRADEQEVEDHDHQRQRDEVRPHGHRRSRCGGAGNSLGGEETNESKQCHRHKSGPI